MDTPAQVKGTPVNTNLQLADQFDELADRLSSQGDSWFKVAAYRRAASTLRNLQEEVAIVAAQGRLRKLPGIGAAISSKIEAYLQTGQIPLLERLRGEQPPGLLRALRQGSMPGRPRKGTTQRASRPPRRSRNTDLAGEGADQTADSQTSPDRSC